MREAGFHPEPLGKDESDALARASILLADWDKIRTTGQATSTSLKHGTMNWLIAHYQKDRAYLSRQPKTQAEFDRLAAVISKTFGKHMVAAIERRHIKGFYRELLVSKSQDRASRTIKTMHKLLEMARDEGLVSVNHASRMNLPQGTPRREVWDASEINAVIAACEINGRRSIGLTVRLAFDLGQRLSDVLNMTWGQYKGNAILITQGKTGATVLVPVLPELKTMLDATDKTSTHIVVSEETHRPYKPDNFSHRFREISVSAGFGDKQFRDIRRSAAVRLAEAGCTSIEVVAITGHTIERGAQILETYAPRSAAMAESAINKLNSKNAERTKVENRNGKS